MTLCLRAPEYGSSPATRLPRLTQASEKRRILRRARILAVVRDLKNGGNFFAHMVDRRKADAAKAEYDRLGTWFINRDVERHGYRVKQNRDRKFDLLDYDGRTVLGTFGTETEAWRGEYGAVALEAPECMD